MSDNGHGIRCECAKCQPYLADSERKRLQQETARLRQHLEICKAALKPFADCVGYYRLNERKADAAITLTLCNSDFTAAQQALAQIRELEK